jgi:hypothetical protein
MYKELVVYQRGDGGRGTMGERTAFNGNSQEWQ